MQGRAPTNALGSFWGSERLGGDLGAGDGVEGPTPTNEPPQVKRRRKRGCMGKKGTTFLEEEYKKKKIAGVRGIKKKRVEGCGGADDGYAEERKLWEEAVNGAFSMGRGWAKKKVWNFARQNVALSSARTRMEAGRGEKS